MHQQNYRGRANHADKINQRAATNADLLFHNPTDPPKHADIEKQMQPVEVQKRIRRDSSEFSIQLPVIWKRAQLQQGGIIPNAVRRQLNRETCDDCNN